VLVATDLPTPEEREEARKLVPCATALFDLAGFARSTLANRSIDLIDAALGPGHARAALVALQEGIDVLLQAAIGLVDSSVSEAVLARVELADPLGHGEAPREIDASRLPLRAARFGVEDAAVRTVSAGDHLANGYLRLAWEANAATVDELKACKFSPERLLDPHWTAVPPVRDGLEELSRSSGPIASTLLAFELTDAFLGYASTPAVRDTLKFRDAIVHRERPSYREAPGFGRVTGWREGKISFQQPPSQEELDELPTIAERRSLVASAIESTFSFASASWGLAIRFLDRVDVSVTRPTDDTVSISTTYRVGPPDPSRPLPIPRENRDPGPFLR
jgi:hypothetical protein